MVERGTHDELRARRRSLRRLRRGAAAKSELEALEVGRAARSVARARRRPADTKATRPTAAAGRRPGARTLRDFHEEERLGRAYDAQLLARLWPFVRPHATLPRRVARDDRARRRRSTSLRPLVMGRLVGERPGRRSPDGLLRYGIMLALARRRHAGAHLRADVHDADRRRARDGRPARARLRLHAAARAPLLRPHAGRPARHARHQRRRRASASSSRPACSTRSATSSRSSASSS